MNVQVNISGHQPEIKGVLGKDTTPGVYRLACRPRGQAPWVLIVQKDQFSNVPTHRLIVEDRGAVWEVSHDSTWLEWEYIRVNETVTVTFTS